MSNKYIDLHDFRLPDYPDAEIHLDRSPLSIISKDGFTEGTENNDITAAVGIATVLYHWSPDALRAFLDLDAWFSFTWTLSIQEGSADETNIEIGRVGNQITFGSLDKDGENWTLMLTFNISMEGPDRGAWIPNPKESMEKEEDITDPEKITRLATDFARDLVKQKRWATGKKLRHKFFVEYAPMDIWGDGIPMNPHWLYTSLSLSHCTTCNSPSSSSKSLSRCGRCGTATYCSDTCQRDDWAVHKHVCSLSLEDRGQMLAITEKGGLIMWDTGKTFAVEGEGEMSKNPNFKYEQGKRARVAEEEEEGGEEEVEEQ